MVLLIDLLDKLGYNTEASGASTIFQRLAGLGTTGDAANASGSIFARLAELLINRLTLARAAYLDYINNLNTRLTDARAAKLDNLDAALSTRQKARGLASAKGSYTTTQGTLQTALNVAGRGRLKLLTFRTTNTSFYGVIKITIDDYVLLWGRSTVTTTSDQSIPALNIISAVQDGSLTICSDVASGDGRMDFDFKQSLKIEVLSNNGGGCVEVKWLYEVE